MIRLNIFIDESGDSGFNKGSSQLYAVSFTLHESTNLIDNELKYLNEKLNSIGYNGMIHLALLIAKRGDYSNYDLEKRKNIFWSLFYFLLKINVKIKTIIIDKRYINTRGQLNKLIFDKINNFINQNKNYFKSFDKIVIYYDNGQDILTYIFNNIFLIFSNVEMRTNFNHNEKRLFQISDMLTVIDKLHYKQKNHISLTNAEKFFFSKKEFKHIIELLKHKRM